MSKAALRAIIANLERTLTEMGKEYGRLSYQLWLEKQGRS